MDEMGAVVNWSKGIKGRGKRRWWVCNLNDFDFFLSNFLYLQSVKRRGEQIDSHARVRVYRTSGSCGVMYVLHEAERCGPASFYFRGKYSSCSCPGGPCSNV